MAMLCDVPIHDLAAGDLQLLGDSRNNSGASTSSEAHLKCNLRIKRGSRHLLLGKNGCGKTTMLHAINNGTLSGWPQNVSTFLVDQELNLLDLEKSVLSAVLASDTVTSSLLQRRDALEKCLEQEGVKPTMEKCSAELIGIYEKLAAQEDETVLQHRAQEILAGLGFSQEMLDSRVRNLSGGWRVRAALAAALFMGPELLLLDEPTNHLDVKAIVWLQSFLAMSYTGDKTLICVSHDRSFINAILTEIIVMQDGALTYFNGGLDEFEAAAEEMSKHMEHETEVLRKKRASAHKAMEKMEAKDARQFRKSHEATEHNNFRTNPKSAIHAKNQKDTGKVRQLEKKLQRVGMEKTLDGKKFKVSEHGERLGSLAANEGESTGRALAAAPLFQRNDPSLQFNFADGGHLGLHANMPILQVKGASYAYPGGKGPTLIDVDLCIPADGRIAVAGCNGAGKSTLVNLLLGRLQPTSGEIWRHRNVKIAHLDQHEADQLQSMSCTVFQYTQECFPEKKDLELRVLLASFGVRGSLVHQPLNTLSGGQRVRVAFARICGDKPHLLILDEPTNHLDIYSIDALSEALQEFKGAVVLVTHNCSMLNDCAQELCVVENGACRAASSPVGVKLGDWLLQGQRSMDVEDAFKSSGSNTDVSIRNEAVKSYDLEIQLASTQSMEKYVKQPELTQILSVPTPARPLRATEKEFLRCCKRAREILKLATLQLGQNLDKAQARKLEMKEEVIEDLVSSAKYLPGDSDVLEKNADIKQLLESQH